MHFCEDDLIGAIQLIEGFLDKILIFMGLWMLSSSWNLAFSFSRPEIARSISFTNENGRK